MSLTHRIDGGDDIESIGAWLDGLDHDTRVREVRALKRAHQRQLYERSSPTAPLSLDDFVGKPLEVVHHHGWNTLPGIPLTKRFVKQLVRQPDGRVAGWNQAALAWLIGPGYFVLRQTVGDERQHGLIVVDYFQTPKGELPPQWPWVRPNWLGLQALIYGWCLDYMRPVSRHVTIGAAFKFGRPVGSWFVLVRAD